MDANNIREVSESAKVEGLNLISLSNTAATVLISLLVLSFIIALIGLINVLSGTALVVSALVILIYSFILILFILLYTAQSNTLGNILLTVRLLLKDNEAETLSDEKKNKLTTTAISSELNKSKVINEPLANNEPTSIFYQNIKFEPITVDTSKKIFCFLCREETSEDIVKGEGTDVYAHFNCLKAQAK
jgi:hypothetical protein